MIRKITIVNNEGKEEQVLVNTDPLVFIVPADIPTNVVGLDGEFKTKPGAVLNFINGAALSSPLGLTELHNIFS